jgi:hypothetical protein
MHRRRGIVAIAAPLLPVLLACSTSPTTPSPPPPQPSPFASLPRGYYALEVEFDESCAGFPTSLRQRRYDVVIEDPGWHFLLVRVIGSGFSTAPVIGELWVRDESRGFRWPTRLRWNEGEGDAYEETLTDSRHLHISGSGEMAIAESSISGALAGAVTIRGSGAVVRCTGSHRFTFTRLSL